MNSGYKIPSPSPIEIAFWNKAKPVIPELQKEVWIGKYRVDFLIPSKKTIIELYGYEYHKSKKKITKDAERERYLQKAGWKIIRFTGSEIYKDVDKCVKEVLELANIKSETIKKDNKPIEYINIKENNRRKNKNAISRTLNRKQYIVVALLSVMAICSGCTALDTILKLITK